MTEESIAIPAQEYYAKRVRYYLAERGRDEQVLANVPVYPAGMTQATFAKDVGGLLGSLAGSGSSEGMVIGRNAGRLIGAEANRAQGGGVVRADIKIPKRSMLVLTNERLLIFNIFRLGFFTGKPKKDAAVDIPLTEILWVSEPAVMSGGVTKLVRVDVCVRNRGFARVETPSAAAKKAVALAAEVSRRIESLNAPLV
ncbi:hypothetical protein KDL01_34755 [Actinospica durhamensis]|uniref:Uncharacterized protein n=1 Tax=Actinospica durhamensis TaxID=1508375 RepID=A0A941EZW5_9ACTN|nr:hypothetical protein [Actinospica durhamensis]MBR7838479.1 hypothetical protein [Actinospica durhamensis]